MARPGLRTDTILILIALGLVGLWLLIPRASDDEFTAAAWPDLVSDPPRRITLSRGGERVSFAYRSGEAGQLERYMPTFPPETHANPAALDQLILTLSRLQTVRRADAAARDLGLDRPALVLELEANEGARRIELGNPAPSPANARYAAVTTRNQRRLIVLAPDSAQALDVPLDTLLDHRTLDVVPSEFRRLQWTGMDGRVELLKNATGQWVFATSAERVRRSVVERFAMGLSELQYAKHVIPKIAAAAHDQPRTVLELTVAREERADQFRLSIGGECPGAPNDAVLLVEGPRRSSGCVNPAAFDALVPKRADLQDDAAFSLRVDELEQLEVRGTASPFALSREGSEFRLGAVPGTPVALEVGNGLLASLVTIRGEARGRCALTAQSGVPVIALKSYVVGDGAPVVERISLATAADGTHRLCRDDGVELGIDRTSAQLLTLEPSLLRSPVVLDVPPSDVTEVRLSCARTQLILHADAHHRFAQIEPPHPRLDAASADTLRERLAQLRAVRWLVPAASEPLADGLPSIDIEVLVEGAASTTRDAGVGLSPKPSRHRVRVVLEPGRNRGFGWSKGQPSPFELEPELAEVLTRCVRDGADAPKAP